MNKILQGDSSYPVGFRVSRTKIFMLFLLLTSLYAMPLQAEVTLKDVSVSIMIENTTVKHALNILEKQSDYRFFYNSEQFNPKKKVTINFHGNMEEALQLIMGKDVSYVISGKHVILKKNSAQPDQRLAVSNKPVFSRADIIVTGTVTDETTGPIPGVNVILKGTTVGTTTDTEGKFSLTVPDESAILVFSFIGYKSAEIVVGNQSTLNIVLQSDSRELDEVVVIGYGAVKKSDLTGAISSISKKDIGDRQVSDLASLIQGRAAGVDVSQGTIRIRGTTSFNSTDPLVVIDGFIGGNLSTVNANDIENIEILKDASSTAIYGSRGANGVILVTTRMGKPGPLAINVSYYEGVGRVPKKLDLLNANQYTDYVLDLLGNSGMNPTEKLLSGTTRIDRTDWQDEVFRTGHSREVNMDFSGGAENVSFYTSLGYRRTSNPNYLGRKDDLFYFRNRNNYTVSKWLRAGNNIAFSYNHYDGGGEYGYPGNLDHTINAPTYLTVRDESGAYTIADRNTDIVEFANPYITADNNSIEGNSINYQAALWAEIQVLKGLTYKIQAGVSGDFGRNQSANNSYKGGAVGPNEVPARLSKLYYYSISPLIEQYVTYANKFGAHDFSVMIGNTWQNGVRNGKIGVRGQDLDPSIESVLTAKANVVTDDAIGKYAYLSYFGRINYQFNNKYLFTLNIRTDGSPKFAPGNRWGTFPSVAVAWKIHEENFLRSSGLFDQLKLRLAWGIAGNDAIGDFRYLSQVYTNNVYYTFGESETRTNGATILNNASPDIQWESTEARSVGLDLAVFENRLTFSADYYNKQTSDILYEVPRAISLGYGNSGGSGSAIANAASMVNKGLELQIGYQSSVNLLTYSVFANYTHNVNKVTSLGDGTILDGINRTDIGNPLGYFYGYVSDGIFMNQEQLDAANASAQAKGFETYQLATTLPGDVRFKDINGDGHVDNTDRTQIGTPHPANLFGVNLNLGYKGFDFNAFFQGVAGVDIYDGNYDRTRGGNYVLNQYVYVINRWQDESNPGNGIVPRAVIGDPAQNGRPSDLKLSNGSYLKVKQISLGYSVPDRFTDRLGIDNLRFYVSAYNYFTITGYKYGYDPEVGGENLSRGIDNGNTWPKPKLMVIGVQIKL